MVGDPSITLRRGNEDHAHSMSSKQSLTPSVQEIAEELALLAFRARLLDTAVGSLAPLADRTINPPESLRHRVSTLLFYLCGFTIVRTYGQTRHSMDIYREFRERSMQRYPALLHNDVDDAAKRYADALRRRDPEYATAALAEAFVDLAKESENVKLKLALFPLIEIFQQEINRLLDEIMHKPIVQNPIPREVSLVEVEQVKRELLAAGPDWYGHLFAQLQHPASQMMLTLLPGGRQMWGRVQFLGTLGVICLITAAVLPFIGLWPVSLMCVAIWYFGLTTARREAVYDIAARLFTLNKELRNLNRPLLGKMKS